MLLSVTKDGTVADPETDSGGGGVYPSSPKLNFWKIYFQHLEFVVI